MIDQLQGLEDTHGRLKAELQPLYGGCCNHLPDLAAQPSPELLKLVEKMLRKLYAKKGMPDKVDAAMVKYFAEHYMEAVEKGFGATLAEVDFTTPDYIMLRNLQNNVYQFSAAKNYQQLKSVTKALVSPEGKLRSFNEFKRAAFEILAEQNTTWLKAEYDFAVANGQMAATWSRAQDTKDILPMLEYITVGDDRVRPAHKELDGVKRPVDDGFWDMYYPPNGWGCRCDVKQLSFGQATPLNSIVTPEEMPAMFKTNLAKNGLVFPKNHPYYTGLPAHVSEQAQKLANGQ